CARGAETNFPKGPSDNDLRGKSSFPPRPRCREPSPPSAATDTDPRPAVGEGDGGDDERPVGSLPPSKPPTGPAPPRPSVCATGTAGAFSASAAVNLSSLSVVGNALRLRRARF